MKAAFLVSTAVLAFASPAFAQQASTDAPAPSADAPAKVAPQAAGPSSTASTTDNARTGLEDIVVVARRSSESQQKVPVAVTTVTAEALTSAAVDNASLLFCRRS